MVAQRKLLRFEIGGSGSDFTLHIEDDAGNQLELMASRDQLDVLADSIDDILLQDESGDEIKDD